MTEEKKQKNEGATSNISQDKKETSEKNGPKTKSVYADKIKSKKRNNFKSEKKEEFEQRILDIARVTRVMAGGKRMNFRACVAIGDKQGKVGVGLGKGADVAAAVTKAVNKAKKSMVNVPIVDGTIPHEIYHKYGAAKLLFKPAREGRGVVSGGIVRIILELAGVKNVSSKILGTNNKINNAQCATEALARLKNVENKKENNKDTKEQEKNIVKEEKKEDNKNAKK